MALLIPAIAALLYLCHVASAASYTFISFHRHDRVSVFLTHRKQKILSEAMAATQLAPSSLDDLKVLLQDTIKVKVAGAFSSLPTFSWMVLK